MAKKEAPAGYCTASVLGNLFDVSEQYIGRLVKDGVIKKHRTDGGMLFHIAEATRDYVRYLRDKAAGREKNVSAQELEAAKMAAEVRIKEAKASTAEVMLAELNGKMHRSEDVQSMTEQLVFTIRSMLIALPGRLAVDLSTLNNPSACSDRVRREVDVVMMELARFRYDPAAYEKLVRERQQWEGDNGTED